MTKEEIKAALTSSAPVQIVLTEEEEAEAIEVAFGGDRTAAANYKARATTLFQEALDRRVDQILDEARMLIEQIEQEQADLQHIALDLLKDKIIERMTPRLSLLQREKLKSHAVSWEVDLLSETERRAQRQGPHPCSPLIRMPCLANTHLHGPGKLRCKPTIMSRPSIAGALHFSGINCQSGQGVMLTMQRDPWRRVIIQMASAWRQFLFWLVSRPTRPRYQSRTMHPQFLAEDVLHERIRNERLADRLVRHKRLK